MRILIVSQYFYPENFKINDITFFLKSKGFDITVLTSKPNYPQGRFFKGYNFFSKNTEIINGVKIIRVPTIPRLNGGALGMILNYSSFLFFSFLVFLLRIKNKYDLVFATLLTPATSLLPMIWIKKRFKIPVILWVLDLWPDSFYANTNYRIKPIDYIIEKITNKVYNNSDSILISSNYFRKPIIKRLNLTKRFIFFPNWAEDVFYDKIKENSKVQFTFPDGYNIVFTGNIGESQGFEDIIEAAKLTLNTSINWILIGDGRKKDWIETQIKEHNIKNIYIPGRFPLESMPSFFFRADALLITLKKDEVFSNTLPAKLQPYLTSGKPILGNLSGEGLDIIQANKIGLGCNPGNSKQLSKLAKEMALFSKSKLSEIKKNCLKLNEKNFKKEKIFSTLLNEIKIYKNENHNNYSE
jgi:glycosyltransferase involved in cell wall biosynthesis